MVMKERSLLRGGKITITSGKEHGTNLLIQLPG
jgi:signal transduction histidine kinase